MKRQPPASNAYFMKRLANRHTNPIEKIITPTITMFAILAVITPTTFSFIVSTTLAVVEATSASTAAKAFEPANNPPATARERAVSLALLPEIKLLILVIIVFIG